MKQYKIIDCHAHLFPNKIAEKASQHLINYYHLHLDSHGRFDELKKSAEKSHVDTLVLLSSATTTAQVENINTFVSDTVRENSGCIGFGTMHYAYHDIKGEMERIKALGLKGLKLHAEFQNFKIDDEKMFPIYEEAIRLKLPVLFHLGDKTSDNSSPERMARILDRYPEMIVIGAHMGGVFMWEDSKKYLIGKNLYMDTSSVFDYLEEDEVLSMIRAHGVDHILFGTDFPIRLHESEIAHIMNLDLTEEEREKIFHKNAEKLFHLE